MLSFLFGKTCKRSKKSKSSKRSKKRYNVPGSVCNKRKKKNCKSNKNCSWTRSRGCSMRKGPKTRTPKDNAALAQEIIQLALAAAREVAARGGSAEEQAEAAAAAASDACAKAGLSFDDTRYIAGLVAREVAGNTGGDVAAAVETAQENVSIVENKWNLWAAAKGFFRKIGESTGLLEPPGAFSFGSKNKFGSYSQHISRFTSSPIVSSVLSFGSRRSGFGKRTRKVRRTRRTARKGCKGHKNLKKVPARLRRLCRKYKIKTTKKVGKSRVCKSLSTLKKQLKRKMKTRR
jgi:hypothetical protein